MARRLTSKEKLRSFLTVATSGATMFAGISLYKGNEKFYDNLLMPLMRFVDPETAHNLAISASKYGLVSAQKYEDPSRLSSKVWSLQFGNPVGIAAGFDKHGEAVQGLYKIGFGFVEVGSVTPEPQPGNPKPRVFRLVEDRAVINRYGFNSDGHEAVYQRLWHLKTKAGFNGIVGVNLGKNKHSEHLSKDYVDGIRKFGDLADYFVINISSPNTPGLRDLQHKKNLEELLSDVNAAREALSTRPPLLVKLAPDLTETERQDIADVINGSKGKVDGLIISNTTIARPGLKGSSRSEAGGLSGAPLTDVSTAMIADMYRRTRGRVPIIGVGGIFSGKDAYDKIKAGASLVQLYTSYIFHGPPVVNRVKRELDELLEKDGYRSVEEAVGKNSGVGQSVGL